LTELRRDDLSLGRGARLSVQRPAPAVLPEVADLSIHTTRDLARVEAASIPSSTSPIT
jgi:hypothetical protein